MGAFALVALVSLPSLPSHCRQHCELACWRHCQHRAIIVADVAPTLLPLLRGCLCPCPAGIATLGIPALPPASQTGLRPVMMQSRHIAGEALLSHSLLLPVAIVAVPGVSPQRFGLRRSGQGSDGAFFSFFFSLFFRRCAVLDILFITT